MKPEDIQLTDIMRILQGQVPWSFLFEVVIRIVFLYLLLVVSMRLMGRRMASMLNRNEMAALVSLAAAIGVPMLAPDRGLLPALLIATVVVLTQRGIAQWARRNKSFERISQDDVSIIVEDGRLQHSAMLETLLSRERLFAELRFAGLDHLGKVKRAYMESNGSFTVLKQPEPQPGLTLLPGWDEEYISEQPKAPDTYACCNCGHVRHSRGHDPNTACDHCGEKRWTQAVV
ncbi:YetF domain-containing protein [Solirubrum puertoriconensis]|uniref:YetF C-terminal domain-containing protein n=1 Tax=Solirubrum puertoriconensis TaxID=1751427 RepID=A0A9X0HLP6_SOLP1|nr:YetF domain-containing protein [Solirubrum puertoriconensis]KUG08300.1 hypothetical protein ASU33_08995 [Solirubrum puertoriconensis]